VVFSRHPTLNKTGSGLASNKRMPFARGLWEDTAPAAPAAPVLRETLSVDVVVIGAGYTGLSAALHLALKGASVAVLEAVDVGYGGSGRNVGLVNAGMWVSPDEVAATLGLRFGERLLRVLGDAPALVFELIDRYGIQCETERQGTVHCAVGQSGLKDLERRAAQWQARGAPVHLLSAAQTADKLGTQVYAGSLWDRRAGTIQPLGYARGLAQAALNAGARLYIGSPVRDAAHDRGVWTVRTDLAAARSKWIIVATDAYSTGPWPEVDGEQVHLPYFNLSTAPLDARSLATILPERQGAWDTQRVLCSFRLDRAGRLIFGSVGALEGAGKFVHATWAKRALQRIFPQLRGATWEHAWYGRIGMTTDRLPRFHKLAPNVVSFSGYNGRGIAPGTMFGRLLAEHIDGTLPEDDLPLPVTEVGAPALRTLKRTIYSLGSQLVHLAQARF
jgi:glycine/D-amino acid oxidase-like deaminating enzyme